MASRQEIRDFAERLPHDCAQCPIREDCNGGEYIDLDCDGLLAFKGNEDEERE